VHPVGETTPETYVGTLRAQGYPKPGRPRDGTHTYPRAPRKLATNGFWLSGTWDVGVESATARRGARLDAAIVARRVYLVLSGRGRVRVSLDGRHERTVAVDAQRLYELARPPDLRPHRLTLRPDPGVAAFSFTFG
jgi:hypothetical protein